MTSHLHHPLPALRMALLLALMLLLPLVAQAFGQEYYIGVVSRMLIFALAASSLNLILGFGGMVSLGHAAYFGAGAYTVGILMQNGVLSGWLSWPLAMLVGALLACLVGLISLRTKGVYFIMITLAFAQMIYYIVIGLEVKGGDESIRLPQRSSIGLNLSSDTTFHYVVLVLVSIFLLLIHRLINSRFGRVLQAIRENETRMEAIGYPVLRYKLVCFVIAGALASFAGALLANQNQFVSPGLLHWTQSGSLLVMVILGGAGYFSGGIIGAIAVLMLEEILSAYTIHWQLILGAILLGVVLLLPNGLASCLQRGSKA
ncbi:branched-chain amino acid ABC transporter permease [Verminephrobacter eiseniae]|uniref:Inner-membrane translocator n=1 Tax=Verminephrobacter eiseniae (strain EF01-2) TaxID=391735 RepID=A1WJD5_VEREI|nr:branched-chain amino acid ABC transporter permease [Verminephrobacter eiseniae]ABM57742.1 inner-membrane translocator [Verminephrobacter eiseniae EF01-2]MCW5283355.1 branched-chain amino acid ABC transporter permease [Verminephrobacter eiseniae]MCW5301064.1 branched-chain amino acid ABC transporter permease [Verminephrobacter eiseniae]MCW8180296.1 branched-chain amino acid ABC transporter permease [Verminephrobacter eiseniae]MCW8192522.1 branched-chain amino acid ABC transporter permease [V